MTYAYWYVGRRIVEQEQYGEKKAQYGSYLIRNLSKQLSDEFGTGFFVAYSSNTPLYKFLKYKNVAQAFPVYNRFAKKLHKGK